MFAGCIVIVYIILSVPSSAPQQKTFSIHPDRCDANEKVSGAFDNIYKNDGWGKLGDWQSSGSGPGSQLPNTLDTSMYLKEIIQNFNISSFADIPCGDVKWQFSATELNTMSVYFGGDISEIVIKANKENFKNHKNKLFQSWDLTKCKVPKYTISGNDDQLAFDMVMSRDVIQHLPLNEGLKFVKNVILSDIEYWAVTSYPSEKNGNITTGNWYENNLEIEPFNLPKENIVFKKKSHVTSKYKEEDYFIVFKIDQNIKEIVQKYDI